MRDAPSDAVGLWKPAALLFGVSTAALLGALASGLGRTETTTPPLHASLAFPDSQRVVTPQIGRSIALSPDGARLVYAGASATEPWQLWLRPANALRATPLEGTQASFTPVFSPDGTELAYVTPEDRLNVMDLDRGSTRTLTGDAVAVLDWADDDRIYFFRGVTFGDTWRIPAEGGDPEPVPVISGSPSPVPRWGSGTVLPSGEAMVVTRYAEGAGARGNAATVVAVHFEEGTVTPIAQGSDPTYLESGHLLFASPEGDLLAAPFDPRALEMTGAPIAVATDVLTDINGVMHYAVSETGALVYRTGDVAGDTGGLVWVDREGLVTPTSDVEVGLTVGLWDALALSPDGSRVALSIAEGLTSHLWIQDLVANTPPHRVTFQGTLNVRPRWTPDGDSLTYVTNAAGPELPTQLWIKAADGTGATRAVVVEEREVEEGMISPDREWVAYRLGGTTTNRDLYAMRRSADSVGRPLLATSASERALALSPDGRWLVYVSDETGRSEVFVRPFPDAGSGVWQVSSGGGVSPAWAHNGRELFFVGASNELMAAEYAASGSSFVVSGLRPLYPTEGLLVGPNHTAYTVAPDDARFLWIAIGGQGRELIWVQDWMEEIR